MVVKKLTKKIYYGGSGSGPNIEKNVMSPEEKAIEKTIIQLNANISKKQQEIENELPKTFEMKRLLKEMEDMEEANNRVKHPNHNYFKTITMTSKEKTIEMQRNSDLSNKKQKLKNELYKLLDKIAITQFEIELHLLEMEEANRVKVNLNKKKVRNAKWKSEAEAQKVILEKKRIAKINQEALKQMKAIDNALNSPYYREAKRRVRELLNPGSAEKRASQRLSMLPSTRARSIIGAPLVGLQPITNSFTDVGVVGGYRSKNLNSHSKSKSKKKHSHSKCKSKSKRKSKH